MLNVMTFKQRLILDLNHPISLYFICCPIHTMLLLFLLHELSVFIVMLHGNVFMFHVLFNTVLLLSYLVSWPPSWNKYLLKIVVSSALILQFWQHVHTCIRLNFIIVRLQLRCTFEKQKDSSLRQSRQSTFSSLIRQTSTPLSPQSQCNVVHHIGKGRDLISFHKLLYSSL